MYFIQRNIRSQRPREDVSHLNMLHSVMPENLIPNANFPANALLFRVLWWPRSLWMPRIEIKRARSRYLQKIYKTLSYFMLRWWLFDIFSQASMPNHSAHLPCLWAPVHHTVDKYEIIFAILYSINEIKNEPKSTNMPPPTAIDESE